MSLNFEHTELWTNFLPFSNQNCFFAALVKIIILVNLSISWWYVSCDERLLMNKCWLWMIFLWNYLWIWKNSQKNCEIFSDSDTRCCGSITTNNFPTDAMTLQIESFDVSWPVSIKVNEKLVLYSYNTLGPLPCLSIVVTDFANAFGS